MTFHKVNTGISTWQNIYIGPHDGASTQAFCPAAMVKIGTNLNCKAKLIASVG